jgi:hypothetical protein
MYNIFFLEENDNIKIVFDKLDLINDLVELYKEIGIIILIVDANTKVSQVEKDMIINTLGKNSFKKRDDVSIRNLLLNIVKNVQDIEVNKSKIAADNLIVNPTNSVINLITNLPKFIENKEFFHLRITQFPVTTEITTPQDLQDPKNITEKDSKYTIKPCNDDSGTSEYTYLMDNWWNENKGDSLKNSYCILYNQDNECSLICNYTQKIKNIVDEFGDFLTLREYNNISDKSVEILKELIHNNMYCEKTTIQKKLDAFESLYDIAKINQQEDEKSLIIFYIKQNYIISDDVTKRIKVSVLLEEVETELKICNTNLRHNFANYLYDIGLQKKRYADGMYLYGIESKANAKINNLKIVKLTNNDYNKLLKERSKEIDEIYNSRTKGELKLL